MKKIMALTALASAVTLFAFTASAAAQGPSASVDPAYVSETGTHSITVSGSGWAEQGTVVIPCPQFGGVQPDAVEEAAAMQCNLNSITPIASVTDGSFSQAVDLDIPAEGLVILVGNQGAAQGAYATVMVGEMPQGGMDTGFGGTADGNGVAVPWAAGIMAVVVLGSAAVALRRNG